ncbi:MAG: YceI family protein, partial [Nitriliruptoraceae bacterium]
MTTALAPQLSELTGTYTIDPSHSEVGFTARHAMVTKVRGTFTDVDGTIHADGEDISRSSVEVTIDAASVDTRSDDRDGHLRSADFFDVDTYPHITFTSRKIEPQSDSTFSVTGDLTIKDVTHEVSFDVELTGPAVDPFGNERIGFEGELTVNRKDWGLTWNAALETGGVLVSEKVSLHFDVS